MSEREVNKWLNLKFALLAQLQFIIHSTNIEGPGGARWCACILVNETDKSPALKELTVEWGKHKKTRKQRHKAHIATKEKGM